MPLRGDSGPARDGASHVDAPLLDRGRPRSAARRRRSRSRSARSRARGSCANSTATQSHGPVDVSGPQNVSASPASTSARRRVGRQPQLRALEVEQQPDRPARRAAAAARTSAARRRRSSWSPCEQLSRAQSMPAATSRSSMPGPSVGGAERRHDLRAPCEHRRECCSHAPRASARPRGGSRPRCGAGASGYAATIGCGARAARRSSPARSPRAPVAGAEGPAADRRRLLGAPRRARRGPAPRRHVRRPAGVRGERWDEREPSANVPSPTALAATWDVERNERIGRLLAAEARRKGVDVLLGADDQPAPQPVRRPSLRVPQRGPAADGADRRRLRPRRPGRRGRGDDQALRRQRLRDRALHARRAASANARCASSTCAPFEAIVRDEEPWAAMAAYNHVNGATDDREPAAAERAARTSGGSTAS